MRIKTVSLALGALLLAPLALAAPEGESVYQDNCAMCHSGGGGAPTVGDTKTWQHLVESHGMDTLYDNAIKGVGGMPAKGGNSSLSEAQVKAAVEYMVGQSGVELPSQ
ncbi:c-type cytochrome [Larsenimonas salina]|uniref:c-type cytochrome n=1 Tax=Larsenimonas salina TaxID=1295565 RepID=UPI002072DFA6|nr:c-type cytochrome [Larsenimonas salina]MCM5705112.1 c-type cytochrome [Larsenimonas salina]